ncbi:MAG TPA: DUF3140 domain-containing protein [Actinomycetales bacterium]|nr:DUF3140 domain-containing protein [Actinomycetales bacterium]
MNAPTNPIEESMAPGEFDELWDEFHTVVNMTSRELEDWLRAQSSGEEAEALPDEAGTDRGRRVVALLGKRKTDVTPDDVNLMRTVVDTVRSERREDLEPTAGDTHWRHKLMTLGHDPLRPPRNA